ncbi:hypothetical protein [Roseivirga pacifica]|uniref:hypothetical protein n=1 Tax=Roseivirga pacifica TaxID=1267423 RepID=UPI003BAFA97D
MRKAVPLNIIKSLLANSKNECAFKGYNHPIINENHLLIAELCHIEAYSENGPRFNSNSSIEQINSYENLLFFCHRHHKEVDSDTRTYSVQRLKKIKTDHEKELKGNDIFNFDFERFLKINDEFNTFWNELQHLNDHKHIIDDLKIEIDTRLGFDKLIDRIKTDLNWLQKNHNSLIKSDQTLFDEIKDFVSKNGGDIQKWEKVKYYENPFIDRNWESHNLGIPNFITKIRVNLLMVELKYFEEFSKTNKLSKDIKARIAKLKSELSEAAVRAGLID